MISYSLICSAMGHDKTWIIYQLHDAIWKSLQEWLEPLKIIYSSLNGLLTIFVITAQAIRLDSWKQAIGLAIGSSLGIVDISFIWDWSTIKRFYNKYISFHPHANNCIIFLQCKKTFLLYHCLCNYIRHSEVGGMDREPHSTWVGCLMGCPWDRTRGTKRNEREAPLSQWRMGCPMEGHYDQCENLSVKLLSMCPTKRMSLGCPWK